MKIANIVDGRQHCLRCYG